MQFSICNWPINMAPRKVASKVSKLTADYVVEKLPLREYAALFNNNKVRFNLCLACCLLTSFSFSTVSAPMFRRSRRTK